MSESKLAVSLAGAGLYRVEPVGSVEEQEGLTHQIAASPDLYAALEVVLNDLERGFTPTLHLPRIRAALARARGEQP